MNLRDRLRLLRPGVGPPQRKQEGDTALAPAAPSAPTAQSSPTSLGRIQGTLIPTPAGEAFCIERTYELDHKRGSVPLNAALSVSQRAWHRLGRAGAFRDFSAHTAAFVDTETTGLERGSGTYIFLIGVGRFIDDTFRVRQFFMRDYHEEPSVLLAFLQELEGIDSLITFNGKTFDWPLLQTRATLNRLRLPELVHLDLLHPARRLWQAVAPSCRLTQLEEDVLGETRHDDVPGFLIPQLYFTYLQTGEPDQMAGVIKHNRLDILSTAALTGYVGQAAADPLTARPTGEPLPGSDLYTVGRLLLERDADEEGIACLEEALVRGLPRTLQSNCLRLLGDAYRRNARHDEAVRTWLAMIEENRTSLHPYIELAKHYEHRVRDLHAAREWALQALEIVQQRRSLAGMRSRSTSHHTQADMDLEAILHRLQRLEERIARQTRRKSESAGA